jgi:glycosyltransferase involved in cell wall biosynthesis
MRYLADWLRNVPPQVDGVIALDDGSEDGSAERLASHLSVLELVRRPRRDGGELDEAENRRLLYAAAARHRPDWLVAIDADERVERRFRRRAEREIARLTLAGATAASVEIRELWDRPDRMRVDGAWGEKRQARLFAWRPGIEADPQRLHGHWAPLSGLVDGAFPPADLLVYHLRMLRREDRAARRRRWESLDPVCRYQPIGYAHLTDETNLELAPLPRGRDYRP